jgi:hypothetical protein
MGKKVICALPNCGRKLTLAEQTTLCKCEQMFCLHHRHFDDHSCTFDFKAQGKDLLNKTLVNGKCIAQKVETI